MMPVVEVVHLNFHLMTDPGMRRGSSCQLSSRWYEVEQHHVAGEGYVSHKHLTSYALFVSRQTLLHP